MTQTIEHPPIVFSDPFNGHAVGVGYVARFKRCEYKDHVGDRLMLASDFHSDASKPDGLCYWCKDCSNKKKQAWRKANVDTERNIRDTRRARLAGCHVGHVDYDAIRRLSDNECYLCRKYVSDEEESFDHVWPISKGGPHSNENIKLTHRKCNIKKGQKTVHELTWVVKWGS